MIAIGISPAIALPSFLNQANKAKQSEAKTYTGSMNRGQQAYYLENDEFTTEIGQLGLGIKTQTANYIYSSTDPQSTAPAGITNRAAAANPQAPIKAYPGAVNVATITATSEATTLAVLCEGKQAVAVGGDNAVATFTYDSATGPVCPTDTYNEIGAKKNG